MNIYDTANQLAKEIRLSSDYIEYKKAKEELYAHPELKEKLQEFEKAKYDMQVLSIKGETGNSDRLEKLKILYEELMQNPKVKNFFDLEIRFNILIADVNKIIGEAIKEVL